MSLYDNFVMLVDWSPSIRSTLKPVFAKFDRFVVLTSHSGVRSRDMVIFVLMTMMTRLITLPPCTYAWGNYHYPIVPTQIF